MKAKKRIRRDPQEAKALILQTAETLILEEGYAAVTIREVAKRAGVSSTLLHYYYPTADDLLVALYRNASAKDLQYLETALSADDVIAALWNYQTDASRTALGVEFLALANHRKVIKAEIVRSAERARRLQAKSLARLPAAAAGCSPACISMLLTSVSRNLIMEATVGITLGHADARAYVERELACLRPPRKTQYRARKKASKQPG